MSITNIDDLCVNGKTTFKDDIMMKGPAKISFESGDTSIRANLVNPEDLEVEAARDIRLNPSRRVSICADNVPFRTKLHVEDSNPLGQVTLSGNTAPCRAGINFEVKNFDVWQLLVDGADPVGPVMHFQNYGVVGQRKVSITPAGNFGICQPNPTEKLCVNGNALITGNTTITGMLNVLAPLSVTGLVCVTGIIQTNPGTASAPAYSFKQDPNTGVFNPSNNHLCLSTGGSERVSVASTGRVGMGTSSPSDRLHVVSAFDSNDDVLRLEQKDDANNPRGIYVVNSGDGSSLRVDHNGSGGGQVVDINNSGTGDSININATDFVVKGDGKVGISTSAPQATFDVNGDVFIRNELMVTGATTLESTLTVGGNTIPDADDMYSLGATGARWTEVFATDGTIETSDIRTKRNVVDSDLGLNFVRDLRTVSFKRLNKGVTHYGLVAQQVSEVLGEKEFGGYLYDEGSDLHMLRYHEFIAPIIKAIQEQQTIIESLKNEINELKQN